MQSQLSVIECCWLGKDDGTHFSNYSSSETWELFHKDFDSWSSFEHRPNPSALRYLFLLDSHNLSHFNLCCSGQQCLSMEISILSNQIRALSKRSSSVPMSFSHKVRCSAKVTSCTVLTVVASFTFTTLAFNKTVPLLLSKPSCHHALHHWGRCNWCGCNWCAPLPFLIWQSSKVPSCCDQQVGMFFCHWVHQDEEVQTARHSARHLSKPTLATLVTAVVQVTEWATLWVLHGFYSN